MSAFLQIVNVLHSIIHLIEIGVGFVTAYKFLFWRHRKTDRTLNRPAGGCDRSGYLIDPESSWFNR
jgi:hypothetical protein